MRIKPTSAYKIREFISYAYVSVKLYGHLQGGVVGGVCGKELKLVYKYTTFIDLYNSVYISS